MVRRRIAKELRQQFTIDRRRPKDAPPITVLICISGGKDSALLLHYLVELLSPRRDVRLVAGCVDEGIAGYRHPSMELARQLAEDHGVEFVTTSFPDLGAQPVDAIQAGRPALTEAHPESAGLAACSFCGVFRREGINALAAQVGADHVALGHNLDDMAQTVLMNLQKGEVERMVRLAPHGWDPVEGLAPRLVPLRTIPEQEVHAVAHLLGLPFHHDECPHAAGAYRWRQRDIVAELESQVPGARHGLLRTADRIKALAQAAGHSNANPAPEADHDASDPGLDPAEPPDLTTAGAGAAPSPISRWEANPPRSCERCGSLSSQPLCQACRMRGWLRVIE